MSQPLPTDGFRWLEKYEADQMLQKIMEFGVDDEKGYILEVDLEMPKDKCDYFNHYPPAPEHVEVTEDMLSNFNLQCMKKSETYKVYQIYPQSPQQEEIYSSLQSLTMLHGPWNGIKSSSQSHWFQPKVMAEAVHWIQHWSEEEGQEHLSAEFLWVDEKLCLWKGNPIINNIIKFWALQNYLCK